VVQERDAASEATDFERAAGLRDEADAVRAELARRRRAGEDPPDPGGPGG